MPILGDNGKGTFGSEPEGWKKLKALGRGREKWSSDERILGSSEFGEEMLREIEGGNGKRKLREVPSTGSVGPMVETVGKELGVSRGKCWGGAVDDGWWRPGTL